MVTQPDLYPSRARDVNVRLIRNVRDAPDQTSFDRASQAFEAQLHPSLYAELDWMERTMPNGRDPRITRFVDNLFLNHLESILATRRVEFDIQDDALRNELVANRAFYGFILETESQISKALGGALQKRLLSAYRALGKDEKISPTVLFPEDRARIETEFAVIRDRTVLPLLVDLELENALAWSLDHPSTRMASKAFLRANHGTLPHFEKEFQAPEDVRHLGTLLGDVHDEAVKHGVLRVAGVCKAIQTFLDRTDVDQMNEFNGETAKGYGHCGTCSMMFASRAIVSLDPTCSFLFEDNGKRIYLPAGFNTSQCIFCGTKQRANTPAMFYSPHRKQAIFCAPTLGQFSEEEAERVHGEMIGTLIERYKNRITGEQAAAFDQASQEVTYSAPQFLVAIQMGTSNRVWHAFNRVRLADGTGVIVDPTTGAMIELLTPSEVHTMWDLTTEETEPLAPDQPDAPPKMAGEVHTAVKAYADGNYTRARRILEAAHKKDPTDEMVKKNLATVYLTLGKKQAAAKILRVS